MHLKKIINLFCFVLILTSGFTFGQDPGKIVTAIRPNGDGIWNLYQYNTDGTGLAQLSFTTQNMQLFRDFSRDGRRVVFESSNNIYVMNSNGKGLRQLTFTNNNWGPTISDDGNLIAFVSNRNSNTDVYLINWDGTNLRRLTTDPFFDDRPDISPDGTKVLFTTTRFSQFGLPNLITVNLDGSNETQLTFYIGNHPRYSPDGTLIVFAGRLESTQSNWPEILIMSSAGGPVQQLTTNDVRDELPTFSLDGSLIAFERDVEAIGGTRRDHIFTMTPTGGNVQQVTFPDAMNENREIPRWVPSNLLATRARTADFDGEGRGDVSVFRGATGEWFRKNHQAGAFSGGPWGIASDKLAHADYDRDAVTDYAIFRDGTWWIINSISGSIRSEQFGMAGDIPVPGDFDADGFADIAVFRPSTGMWWRRNSSDLQVVGTQFGQNGDVPMAGDFDGDAKRDIAVFRPSNSFWYFLRSSDGQPSAAQFGSPGDAPLNGDFNGDGRADLAVFRPSNGTWYIARPTGVPSQNFDATPFGITTDKPVPADYDGDGKTDIAVFRDGTWWILRSSMAQVVSEQFGLATDRPVVALQ